MKLLFFMLLSGTAIVALSCFKSVKPKASATAAARAEYNKVAPNVRLHVTDWGTGKPVVQIHGYPLSDASRE